MKVVRNVWLVTGIVGTFVCACSDDNVSSPTPDVGRSSPDRPATSQKSDASMAVATRDTATSSLHTDDAALSNDASLPTEVEDARSSEVTRDEQRSELDASESVAPADAGALSQDAAAAPDANLDPADFMPPRGPCAASERIGRFIIESQIDFGVVQGTFSDAVVPTSVPDVVANDGTCRLDMRRTLSCLPACISGQTCGEDGACIAYPARMSVGQVAVTGLTKPTQLAPQNPGFIYLASGANNPPYIAGSEIVLTASGSGDIPRFDLFGVGSTPLNQGPHWVINEGEDLVVTWPFQGSTVVTTVLVELTIDQHGTSPLSLSCEFPDTGSGRVPATFIDQMLSAGVSGFPNGRITRRTADHVDVPIGCVELTVGSPRAASVSVTGHTPCKDSEECPEGQTCNIAIEQCE